LLKYLNPQRGRACLSHSKPRHIFGKNECCQDNFKVYIIRLYKPKYKSNGKTKQVEKWWLEFRDPNGIVQRWGLKTNEQGVAETIKKQINSLNEWAKQGLPPPKDLLRWAQNQKLKLYDKMYSAGILGNFCDYNYKPAPTIGTPLEQLQDIDIPYRSGIYFAFDKNKIVYVGKSVNLQGRIKPGHKKLKKSDDIAWLEYPIRLLNFAESFYIGICKPRRNFGGQVEIIV